MGRIPGRCFTRYKRPLTVAVFAEVPLIALIWLGWFITGHGGGGDFVIFRRAGDAVLHGHSPYVAPTISALAANDKFVYPTPFAYAFTPFALLPAHLAAVAFLLASAVAVAAGLWLLGVRDWRCYGAALLAAPVFGALGVGAIGPFLFLLVAGAWRLRDTAWAGPLVALAAAAKLFLWPLLIWLIVTRRIRASWASVLTLASLLLVWAAVDLRGLEWYPRTLARLNEAQRWKSYSPQTLALSLGAPSVVAEAVVLLIAVAVVGFVGWHRRDDAATLSAAVIGALAATPILWMHYLTLLLVPIALLRPRLTSLWLLPVALWVTPHPESLGTTWKISLILVALAAAMVFVAHPRLSPQMILFNAAARARRRASRAAPARVEA